MDRPADQPLRVLHVYSGNLYGGIETFLCALAEERSACPEMAPEFALCFEGRIAEEIRASGAPLHMLGPVRMRRPWSVHRARRALSEVVRTRTPDVVVCHAAWPYAIFASTIRAAKARLVFYRHDIGGARDWMNLFAGRIEPDAIVANSAYTAKHGHPIFRHVETRVVHCVVRPPKGVTPNERTALRTELGAGADDVVILQASRMQAWKGQTLLLDALAQLPKALRWQCWFAGDAQRDFEKRYVAELKGSAEKAGIADRVHFLGQRSDVPALMGAADLFCQANLSPEPFGIAFVEALAAGLPVVTTDVAGGALEIVDATCGRVAAPRSEALAEKLRELVGSEATRRDLSARAKERARAFTNAAARLRELAGALGAEGSWGVESSLLMEVAGP